MPCTCTYSESPNARFERTYSVKPSKNAAEPSNKAEYIDLNILIERVFDEKTYIG